MVYAATKDITLAAQVANVAGGQVCEEVGTVAVNKDKLLDECLRLSTPAFPATTLGI